MWIVGFHMMAAALEGSCSNGEDWQVYNSIFVFGFYLLWGIHTLCTAKGHSPEARALLPGLLPRFPGSSRDTQF